MSVRCGHRHGERDLTAITSLHTHAAAAYSLHTSTSPRLASPASAPFARAHPQATSSTSSSAASMFYLDPASKLASELTIPVCFRIQLALFFYGRIDSASCFQLASFKGHRSISMCAVCSSLLFSWCGNKSQFSFFVTEAKPQFFSFCLPSKPSCSPTLILLRVVCKRSTTGFILAFSSKHQPLPLFLLLSLNCCHSRTPDVQSFKIVRFRVTSIFVGVFFLVYSVYLFYLFLVEQLLLVTPPMFKSSVWQTLNYLPMRSIS
jgi:hypothetical protein